jgi:hypothetical protein
VQLKSGLVYVDTKVGTGDEVQQGRRISMRYMGTLVDGTCLSLTISDSFLLWLLSVIFDICFVYTRIHSYNLVQIKSTLL